MIVSYYSFGNAAALPSSIENTIQINPFHSYDNLSLCHGRDLVTPYRPKLKLSLPWSWLKTFVFTFESMLTLPLNHSFSQPLLIALLRSNQDLRFLWTQINSQQNRSRKKNTSPSDFNIPNQTNRATSNMLKSKIDYTMSNKAKSNIKISQWHSHPRTNRYPQHSFIHALISYNHSGRKQSNKII